MASGVMRVDVEALHRHAEIQNTVTVKDMGLPRIGRDGNWTPDGGRGDHRHPTFGGRWGGPNSLVSSSATWAL